ncbi:MAG: SRPBCC domain-containing protein [Planctomycetota bacterium]
MSMPPVPPVEEQESIRVEVEVEVKASAERVWSALTENLGNWVDLSAEQPMHLKLEPWVGGRYFRDLGEGSGHLWGFVQVYKPPKLLELWGPMFVSTPSLSHIQFRLEEENSGTRVRLVHLGIGMIAEEFRAGAKGGWDDFMTKGLKAYVERDTD